MRSSLRLQLLAWLLVPLGFLVAVNTWLSFREASATATAVQDRMLLGAIRIIAEQTYYRAGELHVEVPPAALELFESASRDRVYYRVVSPRGALLLGYPELPSPARPLSSQIWEQAIVHQLIMLALTIVMVWLGLRFGLRPLIRLRDAVLERRAGALEPLDPGPVPQELAPLVTAVNDYVHRLDEHMAAHGRFVAYASHQLRTALSVLNTQVSFALRSEDAAVRQDALQAIRDGVRDGIRLVNQLLTLFIAEAAAHSEPRQPGERAAFRSGAGQRTRGVGGVRLASRRRGHGPRVDPRSSHELAGEGLGEIDVLELHVAVDRAHYFQHRRRARLRHAAVEREHRLGCVDRPDIEGAVAGVVLRRHRGGDLFGAARMDIGERIHQRIHHALDLRAVALGPRAVQVEAGRGIKPAERLRRRLGSAQVDQQVRLAAFQQPRNRRLGGHPGVDRAFAHRGDEPVTCARRHEAELVRLHAMA